MMSKLKQKESNITTLSLSSSSSSSSATSSLPTTITKATQPFPIVNKRTLRPSLSPLPKLKDKRRLQQRRNSSSPVTKLITNDKNEFNKQSSSNIPLLVNRCITGTASTNSSDSLNSIDKLTNSPGQLRRSRIPVIINSPSKHNSRRSISASLRTNLNFNSPPNITTKINNKIYLQHNSPPLVYRKRISNSLSRDSSPTSKYCNSGGGIRFIGGNYHIKENINNSNCNNQQKSNFNEQKQIHEYYLNKQQQLQYNENNKKYSKDNISVEKQQQNNTKPCNTREAQHTISSSNIQNITVVGEKENSLNTVNITENQLNEKDLYNMEFSERKDINEMSALNTNTDENLTITIDNSIQKNDNQCDNNEITEILTEQQLIDNMAEKMDDIKITSTLNNENLNQVDEVDKKIDNNINESIQKFIPNGNCVVENQIKCQNSGCCAKVNCCCSPISPIAENEELKNPANKVNKTIHCNGAISKTSIPNCSNTGAKMKRDSGGMILNLNGPSASNGTTSMKSRTPVTPKTPHTPKTPSLHKSNCPSTSTPHTKLTPKTPPVTPDSYNTFIDDDLDSVYSYSSGRSTMSCDHPYVARNGTTFSGRKMKYVVHCSAYAGQVGEDYLTPTQRAQRQLRRLKELLSQARQDLEQKDSELLRLTREVVELRLFKASLSSPEDPSNSSDAVTVREAPTDLKTSQDVSPIVDTMMLDDGIKSSPKHVLFSSANRGNCAGGSSSSQQSQNYLDKMSNSEMQSSFADSGHFEDMTTSQSTQDQACGSDSNLLETYEEQRAELIQMYEKKIEELIKTQDDATGELKQSHNDRVEALLQKLADINTRYADMVPDYEQAKERIRELEKQLEDLQQKLLEHEEKQKKMYLHMYQKGQEAERIARAEQIMEIAHRQPNHVSIPELLQQLQSTQDELENIRAIYHRLLEAQKNKQKVDPEITLQFLKSAIYYFLTDKENSQGHLNAIESILEFSEDEKKAINKARQSK